MSECNRDMLTSQWTGLANYYGYFTFPQFSQGERNQCTPETPTPYRTDQVPSGLPMASDDPPITYLSKVFSWITLDSSM